MELVDNYAKAKHEQKHKSFSEWSLNKLPKQEEVNE